MLNALAGKFFDFRQGMLFTKTKTCQFPRNSSCNIREKAGKRPCGARFNQLPWSQTCPRISFVQKLHRFGWLALPMKVQFAFVSTLAHLFLPHSHTNLPFSYIKARGTCELDLCVCDPMWTGKADFFPLNSCQNPIVLDKLMWSITAAAQCLLLFRTRNTYLNQWRLFREGQREVAKHGSSHTRNNAVFYASSILALIAMPTLICTFIARSVTDLHFGVDLSITLPFVFGYALYLSTLAVVEHQLFRIMVNSADSARSAELIHSDWCVKCYGTCLYVIAHIGTIVASIYFPVGPNAGRIGLLLATNTVTVLYFFTYYHAHTILTGKLRALLDSSNNVVGGVESSERLRNVLESLVGATQKAKQAVGVMAVVNIVFACVPQLYAFCYVKDAMLLTISAGKNHPLMMMSNGSEDSNTNVVNNNNNELKTNTKVVMISNELVSNNPSSAMA